MVRRLTQIVRPRRASILALGTAGLCLFGQLSPLAHFAFTAHAICAEHGEWVHTHDHSVAGEPNELHGGHADVTAVSASSHQPGASHDHQHCTHWLARRYEALPSTGGSVVLDSPQQDDLRSLFVETEPLRCARLYTLAPKASPPA
jgi:hypothetical protein